MISGKAQLEGNFLDEKCRRCITRGSFLDNMTPHRSSQTIKGDPLNSWKTLNIHAFFILP